MSKVLLVDDSMFTRSMLKKLVKEMGHEVVEAVNGREGLDAITREEPDIVITDLLMPEVDGIGLLEGVKEKNIDVPVAVLSANVQDSVREQCIKLGAAEFFNKPPNKEKLKKYIEESLVKGDITP
ncbi:MAG: response regulator [Candidatus Scalindua sp.]|nr:response regulator [Candidatus Scalindua sp.]